MKSKIFGQEGGITLIALVITIIVLLILAGVAISMLSGDNGLLKQAEKAKLTTENKTQLEKLQLAAMDAAMKNASTKIEYKIASKEALIESAKNQELDIDGTNVIEDPNTGDYVVTIGEKQYIVTRSGYVEEKITSNTDSIIAGLIESQEEITENRTIKDSNEDEVTIPAGFRLASDSATTVQEGIVIEEVSDNPSQFVWVPVGDTFPTLTEGYQNGSAQTLIGTDVKDSTVSILFSDKNDTNLVAILENYVKPESDDDTTTIEANKASMKTQFINEYTAMVNSVNEYGGFYVGRYETSWRNGKVSSIPNSDDVFTAATDLSDVGWTCINAETESDTTGDGGTLATWYGLYAKQKELYNKEADSVVSGMIYGCQWDAIMNWMSGVTNSNAQNAKFIENSAGMGVYSNDTQAPLATGQHQVKKIYDLAGNYGEFTQELNEYYRMIRGGTSLVAGDLFPVSNRTQKLATITTNTYSSRLQLYIKVTE